MQEEEIIWAPPPRCGGRAFQGSAVAAVSLRETGLRPPFQSLAQLFLTITLLSLTALPLAAQKTEDASEEPDLNSFVPLPVPVASSDIGTGLAGLLIYTRTNPDGDNAAPYSFQSNVSALRTDTGFEIYSVRADWVNAFGLPFRLEGGTGYIRNLNANYFGYGNDQNIAENRRIQRGEQAVQGNLPTHPTWIQGEEASINTNVVPAVLDGEPLRAVSPGRRVLTESQDKFYNFDIVRRQFNLALGSWIGNTNFRWKVGGVFQRVRVLSYQGDTENNNTVPNVPTLLDLDRPVGYNATQDVQYANEVRFVLVYDSTPRLREVHPDEGFRLGASAASSGEGIGSHYGYERYTIFWNHYLELFESTFAPRERELILAVRLYGIESTGDLPFFQEPGLGGRTLRGYPARQFVDNVTVFGSVELRYTFAKSVEVFGGTDFMAVAFVDRGRVAPSKQELTTEDWHDAAGGGLGMLINENALLEFAVGYSRYESYFELSFGHTFKLRD